MFARSETPGTVAATRGSVAPRAGFAGRLRELVRPSGAGPIGLDISAEKLHMVQFDVTAPIPAIRAAISLPYSGGRDALLGEPRRFKALVAEALSARPFRGRQVVSCLAPGEVNILTLSYQRAAGEDDAAALLKELRERLKTEIERSVVDYVSIRTENAESTERDAIVAVAPRERVFAYLAALSAAGLEPLALDIGPAALTRLVSALDTSARHPNALLVNFGQTKTYLSVIWGRRLMLDRELDFGEARLAARLARTLDMTEEAALRLLHEQGFGAEGMSGVAHAVCEVLRPEFAAFVAEVNKTLIYTASKTRGQSVERVYLMGSVARYPGVAEQVQRLVSMPADVLNAFNVFPARPDAAMPGDLEPIAGLGLAAGLALRGRIEHG